MDRLIEELADRIWASPEFHEHRTAVTGAWLQRELGLAPTFALSDADLARCVQAATVLALTDVPERRDAAFQVAACAADLGHGKLPGLVGALRVVLARMGNFPALASDEGVRAFQRLPTLAAVAEEARRDGNRVDLGGVSLVLTDFQRDLWRDLIDGASVTVSAPTSAGKSFVLQAYLRELARNG